MGDPQADVSSNTGKATGAGSGQRPRTPTWVKVFAIVVLVLVLLFLTLMFLFGGSHGPGRHSPSGGAAIEHRHHEGATLDQLPVG